MCEEKVARILRTKPYESGEVCSWEIKKRQNFFCRQKSCGKIAWRDSIILFATRRANSNQRKDVNFVGSRTVSGGEYKMAASSFFFFFFFWPATDDDDDVS